jgi:hypothetical protein
MKATKPGKSRKARKGAGSRAKPHAGAKKKAKAIPAGTIRIGTKDLHAYEKTKSSWRRSSAELPEAMHVIDLFKAHKRFDVLVDTKQPRFLKGQLSPDGKVRGARINMLPDGRQLDKAYSLFAKHLTIHDETSNQHWDVLCQNPGGTYAYAYTLGKKKRFVRRKYREVEEFEKLYPVIEKSVIRALHDGDDNMAVPMYTLLKTYIRIGSELYYKAHGHKGLTTLKRNDISIDGNVVTFKFLSKGGVPRNISERFPGIYIKRLKEMLRPLKPSSFVFVKKSTGHPLTDKHFKQAFERYCGRDFYPHIVRSYYATEKAKEFLHEHETATKKELREFFLSIARILGHKRYVKKDRVWKEGYNVTIHYYIEPELLGRLNSIAT